MITIVKRRSESQEATMTLAAGLASRLQPGDIVALNGPPGAGKTCFVRGLARGLGVDPRMVSSPTFIICQEYEPQHSARSRLVHIDAYRLHGAEDLETVGWDEILAAPKTVIAVEWPARIAGVIPEGRRIDVAIEVEGENSRAIEIAASPAIASRLEGFDDE